MSQLLPITMGKMIPPVKSVMRKRHAAIIKPPRPSRQAFPFSKDISRERRPPAVEPKIPDAVRSYPSRPYRGTISKPSLTISLSVSSDMDRSYCFSSSGKSS